MKKIQKIRGAHEINPSEAKKWSETTKKIISFFESYSYEEIRLPIIENTDLFSRSVGEETDIVNISKPITKFSYKVTNPNEIKYELEKAFYLGV